MATKGQMTGMLGTYLAAAELTQQGMIVSITSRNTRGADLMVTDQDYEKTWSIQVKTNRKAATFWLLNKEYKELKSPTHVYVFINLRGKERPDYYIVPSRVVARYGTTTPERKGGSIWHSFWRREAERSLVDLWHIAGSDRCAKCFKGGQLSLRPCGCRVCRRSFQVLSRRITSSASIFGATNSRTVNRKCC